MASQPYILLPDGNAGAAIRDVEERRQQFDRHAAIELRWAEFEFSGQFVRGGVSAIDGLATKRVAMPVDDHGIELLARRAATAGLRAGLIEWTADGESFLWFLPFRYIDDDGNCSNRLRGMLITCALFGKSLELFNPDSGVTSSERRVLFQLVGGLELRTAAQLDAISYETKRVHFKNVCVKLKCGGQTDAVRTAIGQLSYLVSVSE